MLPSNPPNLNRPRLRPLVLLLGAVLLLSGCVSMQDPESSQSQRGQVVASLEPGETFRQEFTSRRSGLDGLDVYLDLAPGVDAAGDVLTFTLYRLPQDELAAQVNLPLKQVALPGPLNLEFPPQPDPAGQAYALEISSPIHGVQVYGQADASSLPGGAALGGEPMPGKAAITVSYHYGWRAALADSRRLAGDLWVAAPLWAVLLLPGWLLLDLSGLRRRYPGVLGHALSLGLSLSLWPVLMLWTTTLGIPWRQTGVHIGLGLMLLLLYLRLRAARRRPADATPAAPAFPAANRWQIAALVLIFLVTLGSRLLMARDLSAPPWVDSVHHAVLTRLIMQDGAFPASYAPLLEIDSASYHSGFHVSLAVLRWLSGLNEPLAMLAFGQVLNALVVLAVYAFTVALGGSPWAGVWAALLAGLFSPMPAYYTSWGRYTQLAALLVLPTAYIFWQGLLRPVSEDPAGKSGRAHAPLLLAAALSAAGLFMLHYRVAFFFAVLVGLDFLLRAAAQGRTLRWPRLLRPLGWLAAAAGFGLALSAPWLPGTWLALVAPKVNTWGAVQQPFFSGFTPRFLTTAWGNAVLALGLAGFFWTGFKRRLEPWLLLLWFGVLFAAANLDAAGWPGGGLVNNISVEISLFLPLAALGGLLLGELTTAWQKLLPASWTAAAHSALLALIVLLSLLAARPLLTLLNPVTFLYRAADGPALEWLAKNIPPGETVVINPFAWGYGLYAGADGGYWIEPLAGHPTLPPPVLYGLDNDYTRIQAINQRSQQVIDLAGDPAALGAYLQSQGLHYVYVGVKGGVLEPRSLAASEWFEVIYARAGAWLLRLTPP